MQQTFSNFELCLLLLLLLLLLSLSSFLSLLPPPSKGMLLKVAPTFFALIIPLFLILKHFNVENEAKKNGFVFCFCLFCLSYLFSLLCLFVSCHVCLFVSFFVMSVCLSVCHVSLSACPSVMDLSGVAGT